MSNDLQKKILSQLDLNMKASGMPKNKRVVVGGWVSPVLSGLTGGCDCPRHIDRVTDMITYLANDKIPIDERRVKFGEKLKELIKDSGLIRAGSLLGKKLDELAVERMIPFLASVSKKKVESVTKKNGGSFPFSSAVRISGGSQNKNYSRIKKVLGNLAGRKTPLPPKQSEKVLSLMNVMSKMINAGYIMDMKKTRKRTGFPAYPPPAPTQSFMADTYHMPYKAPLGGRPVGGKRKAGRPVAGNYNLSNRISQTVAKTIDLDNMTGVMNMKKTRARLGEPYVPLRPRNLSALAPKVSTEERTNKINFVLEVMGFLGIPFEPSIAMSANPSNLNSFVSEARKLLGKTEAKLERLLHDDNYDDQLVFDAIQRLNVLKSEYNDIINFNIAKVKKT